MNMFDKNFASLESSLNRQHDTATRILGEVRGSSCEERHG